MREGIRLGGVGLDSSKHGRDPTDENPSDLLTLKNAVAARVRTGTSKSGATYRHYCLTRLGRALATQRSLGGMPSALWLLTGIAIWLPNGDVGPEAEWQVSENIK